MAVTKFIPELWSARLLHALDKVHVATNLVNRNYEGEIKGHGDTVHINSITDVSVSTYTKGTEITVGELSTEDTSLVIDQAKYFAFSVEDIDKVQAAGDLVDTAMARASYKLNDVADTYLLETIAEGADTGNVIGSTSAIALTAANVYEQIVALRVKLDKANVPTDGRAIVVPPEVYALLLQDDRFTKVGTASEDVVRTGQVGNVAGFTVYESNNCPTTTVGSKSATQIIAAVPDATTFAEQIVSTEAMRQQDQFADMVRGLHVYGAKVTDGKQIAVLNATF